jgi:adenine-specific DNA methylase
MPFREAHFATFPPKLIEPCILAGSARQACEKCGAPWERDVERSVGMDRDRSEDEGLPSDMRGHGIRKLSGASHAAWKSANPDKPLGFKPTCDCENEGTARSTVLDPFGGAGTTGLVADRLGRNATLIELNPKYAEMARKRIADDSPLFGDVA